jgi:multicomponent Na+:H+ antiporter subunit A
MPITGKTAHVVPTDRSYACARYGTHDHARQGLSRVAPRRVTVVIAILAVYAAVGVLLIAFGDALGRRAFLVGAIPPAVTLAWLVPRLVDVVDGHIFMSSLSWVGALDLAVDLRLDGFGATMTLIVAGVGVLVFLYAERYFGPDPLYPGRLSGVLVLFGGAMVGLVQADNFFILYTFWELTAITSFLLIGMDHTDARARAAALHALLVTSAGGLAMLGGFVLIQTESGISRLSQLTDGPMPSGTVITVALVLILVGAFTKSAQYPFHAWLPGAMAAPTPVSAYLHSATMVTAGVYLVARLAPVFATVWLWRPVVFAVGGVTILAGGINALRQDDTKLMLAFGTVSQLGFMVVLFGAGSTGTALAGWVLLVAHSLFKAALFMVVGVLDRETGTRDLRRLPALGRPWWWIEATAAVSAASMAGVPLTAGFIAKEADFESLTDARFGGHGLLLVVVVVGSVLTAAYSARFYWGAFVAPRRRARARHEEAAHEEAAPSAPSPSWRFGAPAGVLALGSVVFGVLPGIEDPLAASSVRALHAGTPSVHLAVWHGWSFELWLSALVLGGGLALFMLYEGGWISLTRRSGLPNGERAYYLVLRALARESRRVTGVVQNGSLPVYAGVILATAAALPAWTLATEWDWSEWPNGIGRAGDVPIAGFLVVAALGAAVVRRRFAAAVFLGATGYAMAALFVAYGAPDLALTQVAVETLSTVVFVLVLRRLPERFERQSTSRRRVIRLAIAGLVGATVFAFAIGASSVSLPASVSDEMVQRAVPDGHGQNVVNVILVDFRALDTLGEITVLTVASIGAAALARVGRRVAEEHGEQQRSISPDRGRRLVFVDVTVQVMFLAVLTASLWLLFAGHNEPGGGFVGGLLAGSAITLRYIAGGIGEVRARSRFRPWTVLGTGLLLATATATFPLLRGGDLLDVASGSPTLPLIGTMHLSSALLFDIGVYLTVLGMVLMAFEAFGEDPAEVRP